MHCLTFCLFIGEMSPRQRSHIFSRPSAVVADYSPIKNEFIFVTFSGGGEFDTCAFKALMIVYHGTRVWSRILQVLPRVKESAGVASLYPTSYTFLNILYTYRM